MPALSLALGLAFPPPLLESDPLAGIPFALRLQTHNGDGVPMGLYQDTDCTIPATEEGQSVAAWRDELGTSGIIATQSNSMKQPTLHFVNSVPTVLFDGVDDCFEMGSIVVTEQSIFAAAGPTQNALSFFGGTGAAQFSGTLAASATISPFYLNTDSNNYLATAYTSSESYGVFSQLNGDGFNDYFNGVQLSGPGAQRTQCTWSSIGTRGSDLFCNGGMVCLLLASESLDSYRVKVETYLMSLRP